MNENVLRYLVDNKPADNVVKYTETIDRLLKNEVVTRKELAEKLQRSERTIERLSLIGRLSDDLKALIDKHSGIITPTDIIKMVTSKNYDTEEKRREYLLGLVEKKQGRKLRVVKPSQEKCTPEPKEKECTGDVHVPPQTGSKKNVHEVEPILNVTALKKTWWILLLAVPFQYFTFLKLYSYFGDWLPALLPELAFNLAYLIGASGVVSKSVKGVAYSFCALLFVCSSVFSVWPLVDQYQQDRSEYQAMVDANEVSKDKYDKDLSSYESAKATAQGLVDTAKASLQSAIAAHEVTLKTLDNNIRSAQSIDSQASQREKERARLAALAYQKRKDQAIAAHKLYVSSQERLVEERQQEVYKLTPPVLVKEKLMPEPTLTNIVVESLYRILCYGMILLVFELFLGFYKRQKANHNLADPTKLRSLRTSKT